MTTASPISEQTLRQTDSDVRFEVLDDSDGNAVAIRIYGGTKAEYDELYRLCIDRSPLQSIRSAHCARLAPYILHALRDAICIQQGFQRSIHTARDRSISVVFEEIRRSHGVRFDRNATVNRLLLYQMSRVWRSLISQDRANLQAVFGRINPKFRLAVRLTGVNQSVDQYQRIFNQSE